MTESGNPRLRPHPEERFAPNQMMIDLTAAAEKLRGEPQGGERGHRQQALFRHGGTTIALFLFERFTELAEHRADGVVTVHLLKGRIKVRTPEQVHELQAGQMVAMDPGVPHALSAVEASEVLVTVHLQGK